MRLQRLTNCGPSQQHDSQVVCSTTCKNCGVRHAFQARGNSTLPQTKNKKVTDCKRDFLVEKYWLNAGDCCVLDHSRRSKTATSIATSVSPQTARKRCRKCGRETFGVGTLAGAAPLDDAFASIAQDLGSAAFKYRSCCSRVLRSQLAPTEGVLRSQLAPTGGQALKRDVTQETFHQSLNFDPKSCHRQNDRHDPVTGVSNVLRNRCIVKKNHGEMEKRFPCRQVLALTSDITGHHGEDAQSEWHVKATLIPLAYCKRFGPIGRCAHIGSVGFHVLCSSCSDDSSSESSQPTSPYMLMRLWSRWPFTAYK